MDDVDAKIAAIETGAQSITAGDGRSVQNPLLRTLYEERTRLQRKINFESNKGRTLAEF